MSEQNKPAIVTFQMQLDDFLFLGVEYPLDKLDWNHFLNTVGYEKIEPYQVESREFEIVWHNNNPEYTTYFIGKRVKGINKAPDGLILTKFPAREFVVVTHEWRSNGDDRFQIGDCMRYADNLQIPDGYIRYDQPGSEIVLMELSNFDPAYGHRWEIWVPIKKYSGGKQYVKGKEFAG